MESNWEAGLAEVRKGFWRRHTWVKWFAGGLLLAVLVAGVAADVALHRVEPFLRARIVEELENRFHARVELDSFHISMVDGLWAEGKGLRIWLPAHMADDAVVTNPAGAVTPEPLIQLAEFRFHAPLELKPGEPIHISAVQLKGLNIYLPPKSHFEQTAKEGAGSPEAGVNSSGAEALVSFEVVTIECTDADLVMETSNPGKLPMEFKIAHFNLTNVASDHAMGFDAELTNPRPQGTIETTGSFGPLHGADLGDAPLAGEYRFDHADLSGFKGIAGILSSTGQYQGTLRDMTVDGQTQTPDFRLTHFGTALPLTTRFHARVDGTNGDTWLDNVDATLGHSHLTAQGQIVRVPVANIAGAQQYAGHDIALTVNADKARIEDFLRLTSHSGSVLLTGDVAMKATLHIPPGPKPVYERLTMNGGFVLDKARFTTTKIQGRIAELSLRGQGRPEELKTTDPESILSRMQSSFQMACGVVTLPALDYTVPGAKIELKGTYGMEGGALDFDGSAKLEATVSKMVGGWKGLLLSPADRYFKRDGAGTEVPIRVGGTREEPMFAIDFDRLKPAEKQ
ncbi:MAG: AsmA-like C-terminal region-containing protein [Terracidiphilus sp.]